VGRYTQKETRNSFRILVRKLLGRSHVDDLVGCETEMVTSGQNSF